MLKLYFLIFVVGIVGASTYYSGNIIVEGDGQLSAKTNIDFATDFVQSSGAQTYERTFSGGGTKSTFKSNYNLSSSVRAGDLKNYTRKNPFNITVHNPETHSMLGNYNIYSIAMDAKSDSLKHMVSVGGASPNTTIESHSKITRKFDKFSTSGEVVITNFTIKGHDSTLSESITEARLGGHPNYLVETWIKGNFSLTSNFSDDILGAFNMSDKVEKM